MNKAAKIWIVNVLSVVFFSIISLTGFINWLILPRGRDAASGFAISLRQFLRQVHSWTALIFLIVILIHLALHWTYIKSSLQKYGVIK